MITIDRPRLPDATPPAAPGPIDRASRSLAPDLARGLLLVFIAVANVWGYLYGHETGLGGRPLDGTALDRIADGLVSFFADDRSRPMFAILYGYGIATMARRMAARGMAERAVRSVLRRRSLWLIALGTAHAALLFGGDILAPYGVTGLVALLLVNRSRRVLLRWFWATLTAMTLGLAAISWADQSLPDVAWEPATTYPGSMLEGLMGSAAAMALAGLTLFLLSQVIIGFWVARAGWLDRPWEHRDTLARVVRWALLANLVGNLPYALAVARVWEPDGVLALLVEAAHVVSGVGMGLGYVCLFALLADRVRTRAADGAPYRPGRLTAAVAAVGERSLTCYLMQSMMLAPLFSRWGMDLGGRVGTGVATVIALAVWIVTVVAAAALARAGRRGPFEVLLRRLTYRRLWGTRPVGVHRRSVPSAIPPQPSVVG